MSEYRSGVESEHQGIDEENTQTTLEEYLATPLDEEAKWEGSLRKRVRQSLEDDRDKGFVRGIRASLQEQEIGEKKEQILAALYDREVANIDSYPVDSQGTNQRTLARLALDVAYFNNQRSERIKETVGKHLDQMPLERIRDYLENGPKQRKEAFDHTRLLKVATARIEAIESGVREDDPLVRETIENEVTKISSVDDIKALIQMSNEIADQDTFFFLSSRALQRNQNLLERAAEFTQINLDSVEQRSSLLQVKFQEFLQNIPLVQEAIEKRRIRILNENERATQEQERIENERATQEQERIENERATQEQERIENEAAEYKRNGVQIQDRLTKLDTLDAADISSSIEKIKVACILHIDIQRGTIYLKDVNSWRTLQSNISLSLREFDNDILHFTESSCNADQNLKQQLNDKWNALRPNLVEKIRTQSKELGQLIAETVRKEVEYYLSQENSLNDRLGVLDRTLSSLETLIEPTGIEIENLNDHLSQIKEWLGGHKVNIEKQISELKEQEEREQAGLEEEGRRESIEQIKKDLITEETGTKTTYLKELYALESGYYLSGVEGYGKEDDSGAVGYVQVGTGRHGPGQSLGHSLEQKLELKLEMQMHFEGDGIYLEMGDNLSAMGKRLHMVDYVAPHEVGHLLSWAQRGTDTKIAKAMESEIDNVVELFPEHEVEEEKERLKRQVEFSLKECVIDALGTKMAIEYGVSDPFRESEVKRMEAHLDGLIECLEVENDYAVDISEQDKDAWKTVYIRSLANIDYFIDRIDKQKSIPEYARIIPVLQEARNRTNDIISQLDPNMTVIQRKEIIKVYRKAIDTVHSSNIEELSQIK